MSATNSVNLNFKYGTGNLPTQTAGNVYVKKIANATTTANGRAKIYIDSPESSTQRLEIGGGDVYVGKSSDEAAANYDVVIDPNGDVIDGLVTGQDNSGQAKAYIIRVVEVAESDLDSYVPDVNANVITFVTTV